MQLPNQANRGAFSPGNFWLLLIGFLVLPVAVYLGSEAASGNLRLPLMLTMGGVGFFLLFGIPQYLWVLAAATIFLPGSIPGLPIPFSPFEIFTGVLLVRFVIDQIIIRKRWITFGYMPNSLLLILFLTVLLYHGIQDRFAMRIFGSNIWGAALTSELASPFWSISPSNPPP